jgi:hypothetical protein
MMRIDQATAFAVPFSLRDKVPAGRMRDQQSALGVSLQFTNVATLPLTPAPLPMGEGLDSRSAA